MFSRLFSLSVLHKFLALLLSFLIALQPALLQVSANHFYGDIQEAVTGKEAHTALVDALTASGMGLEEANTYQRYVDNGVLVVTLGAGAVASGRAAYQFTVNSSKAAHLSAAERATLTYLEQKTAQVAGNTTKNLDVPGVVQSRINLANKDTRFTPRKKDGKPVDAGWEHIVKGHFKKNNAQSQFTLPQTEIRKILQSQKVVSTPILEIKLIGKTPTYVRTVDIGRPVGTVRQAQGGRITSKITIQTDRAGNIITAYPVP